MLKHNRHITLCLKVSCSIIIAVYIMLTIIFTISNFVYTFAEIKERLFYICCRNGHYKENTKARITSKRRYKQRDSRKINDTCLSRIYANHFIDGHVEVEYIPAHTGHELDRCELNYLPLPDCIKEEVATKLSLGVNPSRILSGKAFNHNYYFTAVHIASKSCCKNTYNMSVIGCY